MMWYPGSMHDSKIGGPRPGNMMERNQGGISQKKQYYGASYKSSRDILTPYHDNKETWTL